MKRRGRMRWEVCGNRTEGEEGYSVGDGDLISKIQKTQNSPYSFLSRTVNTTDWENRAYESKPQ